MDGSGLNELQLQETARKAAQGDAEAFGAIYDAFARRIFGYFYRRINHRETAEDLTADVFRKAMESMGSFNSSKGSVGGWLFRIAHNLLVDHWRVYRKHDDIADHSGLAARADAEGDADLRERLRKAERALAKLDPDHRRIILMRVWDDLSYRDISTALGKSEEACRMAASRALKQLREVAVGVFMAYIALGGIRII